MRTLLKLLIVFLTLGSVTAAEDPAHEELRTLRLAIIDAINKGDIDNVIKHVHPDAVITWQNSEVCRGQKGLKEFFERMGKDSFKGYKVPPTPDELTIFHGGDTGISFGETVAEYHLLGKSYELKSRWTATLVKVDGKWLLAGYHISMNVLDNAILSAAKGGIYLAGGVALVIGILIGRILWKRRAA
jgi:ketosteroid isomerase-like protein